MQPHSESRTPKYAELQVITNFSFLRGGSHPHELIVAAAEKGLSAIAVADRNTLAGAVRAHIAAKEVGIKLIVGARLDLQDAPSLLCFPTDRQAYGRLSRLLSLGQGRAEKGNCHLYLKDVADHREGQIFVVLPSKDWNWHEVLQSSSMQLLHQDVTKAGQFNNEAQSTNIISFYNEARGTAHSHKATHSHASARSNACFADLDSHTLEAQLYRLKIALMPESSVPESPVPERPGPPLLYLAASYLYNGQDQARIATLTTLAKHCGTPLIATNDVLYHDPARRPLQDILTCVRQKITVQQAGFLLKANSERHIKSPSEMAHLFRDYKDALANTMALATRCHFSLEELRYEYPEEPVPPGHSPQSYLEDVSWKGAQWRFPNGIPDKVITALKKELALIDKLEYAPYFLTVYDIVRFARTQGILCQGRGSAANSVVCYCLSITGVNPSEVNLLFERFVSAERKEPPDIDVDFEHERREEVIQYLYARYGRDRAGLAATVISYRARSAVREVGKAMGLSEDSVAALAGMVWGPSSTGALPESRVREAGLDPTDPLLRKALALSDMLIGFPRHLSQHVGGFVLTRGPLTEVVPIGNAAMDDRTFIEWDKDDLEALGLLKVDVLALGMLSCIRRAFDLLAKHIGRSETLASIPREDSSVYDMLCKADSLGVFQVESRAQMNMLPRLKPRCYYDLVIEVAIVRPGPIQGDMVHPYLRRRDGLEPETYPSPHPSHGPEDELRQILGKTKGVPLFQEQAMRIAMEAAKFSDTEVNELRKAMATFRRKGTIGKLQEKMISCMVARGYNAEFAERCFNQIKGFGEYGFPESHAASFAHLVYISSWLKCHYPAVFCCAILNAQPMGFYAPAQLVRDARDHGVDVRPVDINHSHWDCTLEPTNESNNPAVRLGMRQVDGMRKVDADKIVAARSSQQSGRRPYSNAHDIMSRAAVARSALEKLATADAFRSTGRDRRQALWDVRGLSPIEPLPLFAWGTTREDGVEHEVTLPQMSLSEHVVNDYQTLRLSLKAHPISFLRARLNQQRVLPCAQLLEQRDGSPVTIAGVVLVRQRPGSAKGVVFMTLEDETSTANVVVWPKTLERYRKVIMTTRLVFVRGRIQRHEDIIHVVSTHLEDRSDWLQLLSEWAHDMPVPIANSDEVLRPEPGSARTRDHPRWAGHPRNERVVPKSRDFH
ncbi:MAG: error-prone DNA polymerase [Hyphomicrobiaceae bacterium]